MIKEALEEILGIDAQSTHYNAPVTTVPQTPASVSQPVNGLSVASDQQEDDGMHL